MDATQPEAQDMLEHMNIKWNKNGDFAAFFTASWGNFPYDGDLDEDQLSEFTKQSLSMNGEKVEL